MRPPDTMGEAEISAFVTYLAVERRVSASTQTQALSALLFLYRQVLGKNVEWVHGVVRAKRQPRLPVVLSRDEVSAVLAALSGKNLLLAGLMYGAGLRLTEALRLRVKDLDFDLMQIVVRSGKGNKDRVTVLPSRLERRLRAPSIDARGFREAAQRRLRPYLFAIRVIAQVSERRSRMSPRTDRYED